MNDAKTIGLFIKELRTEKGYTQARLAQSKISLTEQYQNMNVAGEY